ncbi:uncharacterized protein LOC108923304 isoform X2 [Arapaima gigas]
MEDVNNTPHSMGSGQPPVTHPRPFFYVQPPSQPYYMCQWQMNSPFGHYGLPGSGIPFGRPYLSPYPYVQYPGYVVPHAPMQPIDYRRLFAPHLLPAAAYDIRFRHHCHQQTRVRREMASSEVQTEPSDLVDELFLSLGKLQTCTSTPVPVKDLESGVASQASGTSSYSGEAGDREGSSREPEPLPQRSRPTRTSSSNCFPAAPTAQFESSALFGVGSGPLSDVVRPDGWAVPPDEEPPIDTSSVHEEAVVEEDVALPQQSSLPERLWPSSIQGGDPVSETHVIEGLGAHPDPHPGDVEDCNPTSRLVSSPSQTRSPGPPSLESSSSIAPDNMVQDNQKVSNKPHPEDGTDPPEKPMFDAENLPYRVLRPSCDKIAAAGMLQKGSPLWCVDSALLPPSSYLSSFGNTLYYSCYPQTTQERQSVLSPSLEELSSRDELFSTDLEDLDLPGHIYTGGTWVLPTTREALRSEGDASASFSQEACRKCQKKMCLVCSSRLPKASRRRPAPGLGSCGCAEERESDPEMEDDCNEEMLQSLCEHRKMRHQALRHQQPQGHQLSKQKSKLENEHLTNPVEWEQGQMRECQCCHDHHPVAKTERCRDLELKSVQSRAGLDKQWREDPDISDQESWESCSVKPAAKSCKGHPSHGQEKGARRRVPCNTSERQRYKRNDVDNEVCQKGKGSTKSYKKLM